MCGYKLETNQENCAEIHFARVKILQKFIEGYFLTHTVHQKNYTKKKFTPDKSLRTISQDIFPELPAERHN